MSNHRLTKTKFSNARYVRYSLLGGCCAGSRVGDGAEAELSSEDASPQWRAQRGPLAHRQSLHPRSGLTGVGFGLDLLLFDLSAAWGHIS